MPLVTILLGVILTLLGAIGYFASTSHSVTAWIPAFFGAPLVLLGVLALRPNLRKHMMHVAVIIALLGAIGASARGIPALLKAINGTPVSPLALGTQLTMLGVCVVFVSLAVRSFINARRKPAPAL